MVERSLNCPACKKEVSTIRIQYECPDGHTWGEEVDRAVVSSTPPPPPQSSGMIMPFGKHKGKPLEDIPLDYIEWSLENLDDLRPSLREELENQVELRHGRGVVRRETKLEGRKFKY